MENLINKKHYACKLTTLVQMVVGLEITKHLQRVKPNLGNPLLGIDTKGKLVKNVLHVFRRLIQPLR